MGVAKVGVSRLSGAALCAILVLQIAILYGGLRLAKRMDAIEQGHRTLQDSFLDGSHASRERLASSLGYRRVPTASAHLGAGDKQGGFGEAPPTASVDQNYAAMRQTIAREKKDAVWASAVQLNVRDVVQSLAQEGLPIPATPAVECRSEHCLISFDLGENGGSDEWIQQLITEIAADLPQANYLLVPSADGRSSLQVLANRHAGAGIPNNRCPPGMANCT